MSDVCFLDMDGVLYDFIGGACRLLKCPNPYNLPENKGKWDLEFILGLSKQKFWSTIDKYPGFWYALDNTEEAFEIVGLATQRFGVENLAFLTAPSLSDDCLSGKREAIKRDFPEIEGGITYSKMKGLYASPRHWLIDDKPENCEAFEAGGGHAVLIPRPWNNATGDVLETVRRGIGLR